MSVSLKTEGKSILVFAPYHPNFPSRAKRLNGKWSPSNKAWSFDARDEDRVKELCRSIYGTDGSPTDAEDLVTVRITATNRLGVTCGSIYFAGRCLCYATGRDSGAKLGQGVILISGKVFSGGSMKNWQTCAAEGTVFELRDVPRAAVNAENPNGWVKWEIVGEEDPKDSLRAEREKLLTRIAEIDALLAG